MSAMYINKSDMITYNTAMHQILMANNTFLQLIHTEHTLQ